MLWMFVVALLAWPVLLSCSSNQSNETAADLLVLEDKPAVAESSKSASSADSEKSPSVLPPKELPLPADVNYFAVKSLLLANQSDYSAFGSLSEIHLAFFKSHHQKNLTEIEKADLALQVKSNLARSHWMFVYACLELFEYMGNYKETTLATDKEANFIARMKTITFLAKNISSDIGHKQHLDYAKKLYMDLNERHFGRKLFPRSESSGD